MKRLAIFVGIGALLGIGVKALYPRHEAVGTAGPSPPGASPQHGGAPGGDGSAAVPRFVATTQPEVTRDGPGLPRMSRERRPDESDDQYAKRIEYLDRYELFVRDARLSDEQERKLRVLLADHQANLMMADQARVMARSEGWIAKRRANPRPTKEEIEEYRSQVLEVSATVQQDLDRRLQDVLGPEQRTLLERNRKKYGIEQVSRMSAHPFESPRS